MFTKYNNVNIPQNYSGNRFRQSPEDTEMKTHRATANTSALVGSTKTSVSPYFQAQLNDDNIIPIEYSSDDTNEEANDVEQEENIEIIDTPTNKVPNFNSAPPMQSMEENKLYQLFKNVKNDDLLLLALILLLAKDNTENGSDALAILAFLLMYH